MKYVVTGSEGFLGRNIANRLLAAGHQVLGIDNLSRGHRTIHHENYSFLEVSVTSRTVRNFNYQGYDSVIHCAAVNGTHHFYENPARVLDVGIQGTINVLHAAAAVPEFIFLSSSEVYATPSQIPTDESTWLQIPDIKNPRFSYAVSKIAGEALVLHTGSFTRRLIIRPHNIYGPDAGTGHVIPDLIGKIQKSDRVEIQGTGQETRAFIYIDDFVDAFMLVLEKGADRGIYHIGSGEEVTVERIAKEIGHQLGRAIEIVPGCTRPGSPNRRCPDVHQLQSLGYVPKTSIEEGLKATIASYANR